MISNFEILSYQYLLQTFIIFCVYIIVVLEYFVLWMDKLFEVSVFGNTFFTSFAINWYLEKLVN